MGKIRNVSEQMKLKCLVGMAVLSAGGGLASAAPESLAESAKRIPDKSVEVLIQELGDSQFRTREEASRRIWEKGESALPALRSTAKGKDPEQAYRAGELMRKIQLYLTPDTDPAVIQLVERWEKASPEEKVTIFDKLSRKRAWRQILKLYSLETNADLQLRLLQPLRSGPSGVGGISGLAVIAAREKLAVGDARGACEFLEMAPADAAGLLALADFHRSQGTLETELKRAKLLKGPHAAAWQLALYRAGGNLEQAKNSATAAGEIKISALMSTLLGDPLPWLQLPPMGGEDHRIRKSYTDLAIQRWQGQPIRETSVRSLRIAAGSANRRERKNATRALFLLGEPTLAEPAYLKNSALEAFAYYESLERIPEALKALGLDPEKPDYTAWVGERFETLAQDHADDDHLAPTKTQELITLANFLERRGLHSQCEEAFLKPLATLADKDEKAFMELLGVLFNGIRRGNLVEPGAPEVAEKAAVAWVGENDGRWDDVIAAAFGEQDKTMGLLDWMAEMEPKSSRAERFGGLLASAGLGRDLHQLRTKWLDRGWATIERTPPEKRQPLLEKMAFLVSLDPDVTTSLKLRDSLPEADRNELRGTSYLNDFSAVGRWEAASAVFLKQIENRSKSGLEPAPALHACAAACLRKAGHAAEAASQDVMVEKLALGNDALAISEGYSYGSDYPRAAEWLARAVRQCDPEDSQTLTTALQNHQTSLLEGEKWIEVAAVSEVLAQIVAAPESNVDSPLLALRLRLQSDLGRALANLKHDRAGSVTILRKCYQMFPSDGSLADDFFPSLRKAGLVKEHNEWFDDSWSRISAVVAQFPDCDNTCNTAAWLAARARRNLDQAEKLEEKALAPHPNQSAYLDTMAEIQFAKGNRRKALEWSGRAVNFKPVDTQLRRQNERFRSEPLPK
jgi:tetratricopeptide (TPR) repeat protein